MPKQAPHGLIDRRYQLLVLQAPSVLKRAEQQDHADICDRLEQLLDQQVRVAFVDTDDAPILSICRDIRGMAKVFLFVWTGRSELVGFNQRGKPVRLAKGNSDGRAAGAQYILDAVADPAEIPIEDVLLVAENLEQGTSAAGFLAPAFQGAKIVLLTESRKKGPAGAVRADPEPAVLVALMDGLLRQTL